MTKKLISAMAGKQDCKAQLNYQGRQFSSFAEGRLISPEQEHGITVAALRHVVSGYSTPPPEVAMVMCGLCSIKGCLGCDFFGAPELAQGVNCGTVQMAATTVEEEEYVPRHAAAAVREVGGGDSS
ncbi:uncharacterized protein LOC133902257 [Phragmites australis]|uniref:uncharacterized protein LOC133902257 n=1 Tax=Phragmites australis TaxID=29695 RepID=UPI002D774A02|nr:uncharacterized protein LOC133902257 [Phragmites australis]